MRPPTLFVAPLLPYHSKMRIRVFGGKERLVPSVMRTSSPLLSAHQPTLKGCEEPQSNERLIFHDGGTLKRGSTCVAFRQTSSIAPPATMSQLPCSQDRKSVV